MSPPACDDAPAHFEHLTLFVDYINQTCSLQVPTQADFPRGTILYHIWDLPVDVTVNPSGVEVRARAETDLTLVANVQIRRVFMDVWKHPPDAIG